MAYRPTVQRNTSIRRTTGGTGASMAKGTSSPIAKQSSRFLFPGTGGIMGPVIGAIGGVIGGIMGGSNKPSSGGSSSSSSGGSSSSGSSGSTTRPNPITSSTKNPALDAIYNRMSGFENSSFKKPYQTSFKNQQMYGNNTSSHIIKQSGKLDSNDKRMTVDKYGNWVSDQYGKDAQGTYVLKGGNTNNKVYMNDTNKQYFANNYGGTGGFMYDDKNKVTYTDATKDMRTDSNYGIYGDKNKFTPGNSDKVNERLSELQKMSPSELEAYKKKASLLEQNAISSIDGTFRNNQDYDFSPIAIAEDDIQQGLSWMIYENMRQNGGIEKFEGMPTAEMDYILNDMGLGGIIDINKLNEPFMFEQQVGMEGGRLNIDPMEMINEAVRNGDIDRFFKEGYTYNSQTGQIEVDPQYVQMGNILADTGEAIRWGHNAQGWSDQRRRSEEVNQQLYEEPLEFRAKYSPESLTPEMQQDLEQERSLKAELEQLTLQLQYLDELENGGGGPMVLAFGSGGTGNGAGNGSGINNGNTNGMGQYGSGGASEFLNTAGGGRNAVYGTSQGFNPYVQQEIAKRLGY